MLSTHILNIIREKNLDASDSRAIEEMEGGSGSRPPPDKEKDTMLSKSGATASCGISEKTTETYNENGRFNRKSIDPEEEAPQKSSVDVLV
jgi:hypothetical protein